MCCMFLESSHFLNTLLTKQEYPISSGSPKPGDSGSRLGGTGGSQQQSCYLAGHSCCQQFQCQAAASNKCVSRSPALGAERPLGLLLHAEL